MDGSDKEKVTYRLIQANEYQFLEEMLYEALFVPEGQPAFSTSILQQPEIRKYIASWNEKEYDIAIVALEDGALVGAIWGRIFEEENKGYGYVDKTTPEISMAIRVGYRGKGIGTTLLNQIGQEYLKVGITKLSLSVDKRNPAKRLYERQGYIIYAEQETAITMVKVL